jgi:adenylosuccinate lyase
MQYLSPDAQSSYGLAYLRTKAKVDNKFGLLDDDVTNEIVTNLRREKVPFVKINEYENKLRHDVRGLVRASQDILSDKASSLFYIPSTSYDVINSAQSMALRDFTYEALLPADIKLMRHLIKKAGDHKETVMMGRTHKQHTEATTAGHFFCEMLEGIAPPSLKVMESADDLRAKNSGFVGNNAGRKLLSEARKVDLDYWKYNEKFSELLGLKLDRMTGQTVHQHYYSDYFTRLASMCGGIANFAENVRNYQMTEIGEMAEQTLPGQVGSSTGSHKRNPINCENIAGGQWRHMKSETMKVLEDCITDFQRDLRDSSNKRYYIYGICNTALYMVQKCSEIAEKMTVRKEKMAQNMGITKGLICAEPLQIYLQDWASRNSEEFVDTHEHVRKLTETAVEKNVQFSEVLEKDEFVQKALKDASDNVRRMIFEPEHYIGTTVSDVEDCISRCESTISVMEDAMDKHKKFVYV